MSFISRIRSLARNLLHRERVERELDEELRSYLQLMTDENEARGLPLSAARRQARLELGGVEQVRQQVREVRSGAWIDSVWQDVRYAMRTLLRTPAFTLAAALSIALAVGANTAVFTLVNALLLQPLPVTDPASLVVIYGAEKGRAGGLTQISRMNFEDLERQAQSFSSMAATAGPLPVGLSSGALSTPVFMEFASAEYFRVLGIVPALGRLFEPEEDRDAGSAAVAVLAYGTWRRRFGGDPAIVGSKIRVNGRPVTVIGVASNGFKGLSTFFGPELWAPSRSAEILLDEQGREWLRDRGAAVFNVFGRLRPGIARGQAEAELRVLASELERQHPTANRNRTVAVRPIVEASLFPGLREGLAVGGALLMGVVGVVLLIASLNVANLLLARGASRKHEIAVRLAVGAGRVRIVRQLLTESLLLAALGGGLGLLLGVVTKEALWARRPSVVAESLVEPQFDWMVLGFALLVSVLAGLLVGVVPALQASGVGVAGALQDERRSGGGAKRLAWGRALVAGQVALSLVCLVVASLCLRAVQVLYSSDPGFETKRLALVSLSPQEAGYSAARSGQYYAAVRSRLSLLPGIERVSWAANSLLFGGASRTIEAPGFDAGQLDQRMRASLVNTVDLDYFRTVGLPVTRGRDFGPADGENGQPAAIVNEAFAAMYWPGGDAIGRRLRLSRETTERVIVGVVRTAALTLLGEPPQPCVYLPLAQSPQTAMVLYVRTLDDPAPLLGVVQRTLASVDSQVKPQNVTTVRELMDNNLWIARFVVALFTAFGLLGLGLASVGLYGVIAYEISNRRREIGLRLALGARPSRVMAMVLREGFTVIALGAAIGLPLSALAAQGLSSVLFRVPAGDPAGFGVALAVLLLVGMGACFFPARQASMVDPAASLREG